MGRFFSGRQTYLGKILTRILDRDDTLTFMCAARERPWLNPDLRGGGETPIESPDDERDSAKMYPDWRRNRTPVVKRPPKKDSNKEGSSAS